jgi:hypothetical protein
MIYYQQGDVLIKKTVSIPQKVTKIVHRTDRGLILAEGEHTGHALIGLCHQLCKI